MLKASAAMLKLWSKKHSVSSVLLFALLLVPLELWLPFFGIQKVLCCTFEGLGKQKQMLLQKAANKT
jgi:hypothetical protein